MNNSIKLTIIKILKDTIDKIENDECSLDDEEIMMIMMMIINVHLDILFKEVDIDKLYI